jgi:16S rRNA C967 or C1407 C5-methylase (RsmB/RsmF family)
MKHVNHGDLNIKTAQLDYDSLRMDVKKYYPQDIVFEMMIPKELLKKNTGLKKVHEVIMKLADSGLITRQEIVSMLPPLLLDVHADHAVFDMCAAPGSKTA